tara:strand:+ start:5518 stop:6009 length:492 start_codon:yes stop_codon:yes gene_type:complete
MNSDYFAKGFFDRLGYQLEKKAFDDNVDFNTKLSDKLSEALANSVAFGMVRGVSSALKTGRQSLGPRLGLLQKRFIKKLMKSDSILKGRPADRVISHYTTMSNLAPSISRDPNTVASFLRTSTAYDTIDTVMIKTLIDIEAGYRQRDVADLDVLGKYTKRGIK